MTPEPERSSALAAPSRRAVLGGVAATVIGWNVATASWATAADQAQGRVRDRDIAALPHLDGTLTTSGSELDSYGHDFGRIVTGTVPWAVLTPGSTRDIVAMIKYARTNKLKLAVNGRSGTEGDLESHSNYGQAAVSGGISVDARGMSDILAVGSKTIRVQAGATWAELTERLMAVGKTLPALPDYLHLSVGGTLSVGGIGTTVGTEGLMADTVESLVVVTGTGETLTCSPHRHADLFNTALAGGGQVGVIVEATIRTVPLKEKAIIFGLYYRDAATYMADSEKVLADRRFQMHGGEMVLAEDGSGWRYKLEGIALYKGNARPNPQTLLRGLRDIRSEAHIEDSTYRDFVYRLDNYEPYLKETGHWYQPKPWLSLFLPRSAAKRFFETVEREVDADDLGAGFALAYPYYTKNLKRPMAVQPREKIGYLFDLLRFPHPGADLTDHMMRQNRWLYERAVAAGGKRYLVGAIDMSPADWRAHFGSQWSTLSKAKRRYDPSGILTPGQGFFG
ncbi:FAD-binding protein [Streptomyces otsuchiensis]|uniref:FAD-binding protein n=1 Tax=Streptomyces otsuchiensis TaxID=2681388 RepID=UPI001031C6E1|nr:FAD-binding protein [Streptomyces otsuchiensis]